MRIKQALALRDAATARIDSLDSRARFYGLRHDVILKELRIIREPLAKTPTWCKSYVEGYFRHVQTMWFRDALIFCHVSPWFGGQRYTGHKTFPDWAQSVDPLYKAGYGKEISTWPHAHYWPNGNVFTPPDSKTPPDTTAHETAQGS
jgi:hypothetical protein